MTSRFSSAFYEAHESVRNMNEYIYLKSYSDDDVEIGSAYVTFAEGEAPATDEAKKSNHALRKLEKRKNDRTLDPHIEKQFGSGRLLACVSSPHGHCGRADGYILEKELEFYMKKIHGKKGRGAGAA